LTNGGPTVTDDQAKFLVEKQKKQKALVRNELEKQMIMLEERDKVMSDIQKKQDRELADIITAKMLEDESEEKQRRRGQNKHFAQIWDTQKDLKTQNAIIEKSF